MIVHYLLQAAISLLVSVSVVFGLDAAGYFATEQTAKTDASPIAVVNLDRISAEAAKLVNVRDFGSRSPLDIYSSVLEDESKKLAKEGYLVLPKSVVLAMPENYQADMTQRYIDAIQKVSLQNK